MKKLISIVLILCFVLSTGVTTFADTTYSAKEISENIFLRNDGALYTYDFINNEFAFLGENITKSKDGNLEFVKSFGHTASYGGNFKGIFDNAYYQTKDGTVYSYSSYYGDLKKLKQVDLIKKYENYYFLTENNNLYYTDSFDGYGLIAENVKDFKGIKDSYERVLYRTFDDTLYLAEYNYKGVKVLENCSDTYFGVFEFYCAKSNDEKWYHMGSNNNYRLEAPILVDGNDITPNEFETMVEVKDYILGNNMFCWCKDGNLYYKSEDKKELLYEHIAYYDGNIAITVDGDAIAFDKYGNYVYLDTNIEGRLSRANYYGYYGDVSFVNKQGGISVVNDDKLEVLKLNEKYPDRSDWAETEISQADNIGYIDSVKYIPMQNSITRNEFCNMIVDFCEKYLGKELSTTSNPFEDTENEKVIKAYANGIITGISSDEFAPQDKITREQMCAIMTRTTKFLNPNVSFGQPIAFSDMGQVSSWAVEGVNAMSGLGIVKGDGYSITPQSNTSVEQAIAMTYRLYNKIK